MIAGLIIGFVSGVSFTLLAVTFFWLKSEERKFLNHFKYANTRKKVR